VSRESDYDAEVAYQVWRRGGNPDLVDRDRTADHYDSGCTEDEAATNCGDSGAGANMEREYLGYLGDRVYAQTQDGFLILTTDNADTKRTSAFVSGGAYDPRPNRPDPAARAN